MDELIERIENARSDADYWFGRGDLEKATVTLSRDDCAAISKLLIDAYGCTLRGWRDTGVADNLSRLAWALEGENVDHCEE